MDQLLPHQQRVVTEKEELDEKLSKLSSFLASNPAYAALPDDEKVRLNRQHAVMREYSEILEKRIAAFYGE